jgi:hypothetical protein
MIPNFLPSYKELNQILLSACFFGKAKVREFVKWKNFEVFFITYKKTPFRGFGFL